MYRLPRAFRLRQQHHIPRRPNRLPQRRLIFHNAHKPNGEAMRYQAVRIKRPGFTLRRLVTGLGIEVEIVEDIAEEEEGDEGEGQPSDYALEESLFIPMTWATKMPRTYYKGSDPEWQEFIKIANDKQRQSKIQDQLIQMVYSISQQHPGLVSRLGRPTKVGKFWLDIGFPDGPPQEYERSGIEIGDGFIAWSHQRIDPERQWRLVRALWPTAAFDSVWAMTKVLAGINYRRAKQALGWEGKDPFSPEERYRHAMEMMQKQQQARQQKEVGKAQMDPNGNSGAVVGSSTNPDSHTARLSSGDSRRLPWQLQVPLPTSLIPGSSTDIPIAMHVFHNTLSKGWSPKQREPPKGTIIVQGMVEVYGSRGQVLFDVKSCYDPKAGEFPIVQASTRSFKQRAQKPRGGP